MDDVKRDELFDKMVALKREKQELTKRGEDDKFDFRRSQAIEAEIDTIAQELQNEMNRRSMAANDASRLANEAHAAANKSLVGLHAGLLEAFDRMGQRSELDRAVFADGFKLIAAALERGAPVTNVANVTGGPK